MAPVMNTPGGTTTRPPPCALHAAIASRMAAVASTSPPATAPWSVIRQSRSGNEGGWIRFSMVSSAVQGSLAGAAAAVASAVGCAAPALAAGGAEQLPSSGSIRQPRAEDLFMVSIEQLCAVTACTRRRHGSVYFEPSALAPGLLLAIVTRGARNGRSERPYPSFAAR